MRGYKPIRRLPWRLLEQDELLVPFCHSPTFQLALKSDSPQPMQCQICFEDDVELAGCAELGGALCGRLCRARVCVECFARHVEVTLDGFYAGVLPLVKCPVCLEPMRAMRWVLAVARSPLTIKKLPALREKYDSLCKRACMLTPPCCHKAEYTHLPEKDMRKKDEDGAVKLDEGQMSEVQQIMKRFNAHRADAKELLDFSVDSFGIEDAKDLIERMLPKVADGERRARLMLAMLYRFPQMRTRCCSKDMCFNCKRVGHHEKCEEFDQAADEASCMVRCRECRIMIMKVQGCDSVDCVCGFRMSWAEEIRLRTQKKRQLLPIDLFDSAALSAWKNWCRKRGDAGVLANNLFSKHKELMEKRRVVWIEKYKNIVRPAVARWAWWCRYHGMIRNMRDELFWKVYKREHPEVELGVQEEIEAFLAIEM